MESPRKPQKPTCVCVCVCVCVILYAQYTVYTTIESLWSVRCFFLVFFLKKLLLLYSKDAWIWSKVTIKTFILLPTNKQINNDINK